MFVVVLLAGVLAFFAISYDWNDKRFLAYAYPLLVVSLPIVYPNGSVRLAGGALGAARLATADWRLLHHWRAARRAPAAAIVRPTLAAHNRPAHALLHWDGERAPGD